MTAKDIDMQELQEAIACGKIQAHLYADPRVKAVNAKLLDAAEAYLKLKIEGNDEK